MTAVGKHFIFLLGVSLFQGIRLRFANAAPPDLPRGATAQKPMFLITIRHFLSTSALCSGKTATRLLRGRAALAPGAATLVPDLFEVGQPQRWWCRTSKKPGCHTAPDFLEVGNPHGARPFSGRFAPWCPTSKRSGPRGPTNAILFVNFSAISPLTC